MIYDTVTDKNISKISLRAAFDPSAIPEAPSHVGRLIVNTMKDFNLKIKSLEGNHAEQQKFYDLKKEFIELVEQAEDIDNFELAPVYVESTLSRRKNKRGYGKHYKAAATEYATKVRWQFIKFAYRSNKEYLEDLGLSRHLLKLMKSGFVNTDLLPISIDHKIELALAGKFVKQKSHDIENIYNDKSIYNINHFNNLVLLPNKVHAFKNRLRKIQSKLYNINEPMHMITLVPEDTSYGPEFVNLDQSNDEDFGIEIKSDVEVAADLIKFLNRDGKAKILSSRSRNNIMECIVEELQTQIEYVSGPYKTLDDVKALHRLYKMKELHQLHKKIQGRRNPNVQRMNQAMVKAAELVRNESTFEIVTKERKDKEPKVKAPKKIKVAVLPKTLTREEEELKDAKIIRGLGTKLDKKLSLINSEQKRYINLVRGLQDLTASEIITSRYSSLKNSNDKEALEFKKALENSSKLFNATLGGLNLGKLPKEIIESNINFFKTLKVGLAEDKDPKTISFTKKINKELSHAETITTNREKEIGILATMYKSVKTNNSYVTTEKSNLQDLDKTLEKIKNFLLENGVTEEQLVTTARVKPEAHIQAAENKKTNKVASSEKLSRKAKKLKQREAELANRETEPSDKPAVTVTNTTSTKHKTNKKLNIEDAIIVKAHKFELTKDDADIKALYQLCTRAQERFLAPNIKRNRKAHAVESAIKEVRPILEAEGFALKPIDSPKAEVRQSVFKYKRKEREFDPNRIQTTTAKKEKAPRQKSKIELMTIELENERALVEENILAEESTLEEKNNLCDSFMSIINSHEYKTFAKKYGKGHPVEKSLYETEKLLVDNGFVIPTERFIKHPGLLRNYNKAGRYAAKKVEMQTDKPQKVTPQNKLNSLDKKAESLINEAFEIVEILNNGKTRDTEKEVFELNEVFNEIGINISHVRHYQKLSGKPEIVDEVIAQGKEILNNWGFVSLEF